MMLPNYSDYYYYSFFFTHLLQHCTSDGLVHWAQFVQESLYNEPPLDGLGQTYIKISPNLIGSYANENQVNWGIAKALDNNPVPSIDEAGELELTIAKGKAALDASFDINVSNSLTVDEVLQPIQNYKLLWDAPVFEGKAKESADFIWTEDVEVDRLYPYVVGPQYVYKPWHLEADINKPQVEATEITWLTLTVDRTDILISETTLTDAYGVVPLTADRADYYGEVLIRKTDLELTGDTLPDPMLRVRGLPQGDMQLTLRVNGERKSKTWKSWGGRGYTPASRLGDSMQQGSLTEIAWGIFGLITTKQDYLLLLVLAELTYIWAEYLENVTYADGQVVYSDLAVAGFPDYIPRILDQAPHDCYFPINRSIKENAWLGLALVQAAKYLSNRKVPLRLPPFFNQVLRQLGQLIATSIDSVSGWAITGYDEYGYALESTDYTGTMIASLFLNELLTIQYSELVHKNAAVIQLTLQDLASFTALAGIELYANEQLIELHLSFLFWLERSTRFDKPEVIKTIAEAYRFYNLTTVPTALSASLGLYIINLLKRAGLLDPLFPVANWHPTMLTKQYDLGLYGIEQGESPELITSSAVILNNFEQSLFVEDASFELYASEALAKVTYGLQTAQRLWPYGYQWLSEEALNPMDGELGALLSAYVQNSFFWELFSALLRRGTNLELAQGVILDAWAASLLRPRVNLQSDSYVRSVCSSVLLNDRSSLDAIKEWINALYTDKVLVQEPVVPFSFYRLEGEDDYIPVEVESIGEAIDVFIAIGAARADGAAGFYYLNPINNNQYLFKPWSEIAAQLHITIYEYFNSFQVDMVNLSSAGVKVYTHLNLYWASGAGSFLHNVAV